MARIARDVWDPTVALDGTVLRECAPADVPVLPAVVMGTMIPHALCIWQATHDPDRRRPPADDGDQRGAVPVPVEDQKPYLASVLPARGFRWGPDRSEERPTPR